MRISIVKVGCDLGIQLPQSILKQCGFAEYVSMKIDDNSLVIRAYSKEVTPAVDLEMSNNR
jgi:antitoxin component of MazEF toxin-antitoxin module